MFACIYHCVLQRCLILLNGKTITAISKKWQKVIMRWRLENNEGNFSPHRDLNHSPMVWCLQCRANLFVYTRTRVEVGFTWNKCWGFVTWTKSCYMTVTTQGTYRQCATKELCQPPYNFFQFDWVVVTAQVKIVPCSHQVVPDQMQSDPALPQFVNLPKMFASLDLTSLTLL